MPLDLIKNQVCIDDDVDIRNFVRSYGFKIDGENAEMFEREADDKWSTSSAKFRQGRLLKLDQFSEKYLK